MLGSVTQLTGTNLEAQRFVGIAEAGYCSIFKKIY